MKLFSAIVNGDKHTFVCDVDPPKSPANPLAFAHTCVYLLNGEEHSRVRVSYRSWAREKYPYRTVLHKAIDQIQVNPVLGGDALRDYLKDVFDTQAADDQKWGTR